MGNLKFNKKQVVAIGVSLVVAMSIFVGITKFKMAKASEIEEINEFVDSYKDESQNYLLDEYEVDYNNLIDDIEKELAEKNLNKAKNDRSSLEDLRDKIISKNVDIFNGKNNEINNVDISSLQDDKKQEINSLKENISNLYNENNYKSAIEEVDKLKSYICNKLDEVKKQKEEEEKKKQEDEQKKKQEEEKLKQEKEKTTNNMTTENESPSSKTSNNPVNLGSYVSKLKVAQESNQLVIVKGQGGSDAIVEFHIKDGNGVWKQIFSTSAYVGQAGISYNKHESDRKTPAGVFSFGIAFGLAGNPGTNVSYRLVTNNDYWVDDVNSKYYNKWVSGNTLDKDWGSAEHMIDYPDAYRYGIVINYNTFGTVKGKGSAIFLHCKTRPTPGCVAIPENYMISLLKQINSTARIVIAPSEDEIYNF